MIKLTKKIWIKYVANRLTAASLPLIIISIPGGLITIFLEPEMFDSSLFSWKWLGFRALYNIGLYGLAYWHPKLPDLIRGKIFGSSESWAQIWLAGGITLSLYRLPLFSSLALVFGFEGSQIILICAIYAGMNIVTGWAYTWLTRWCAQVFLSKFET